MYKERAKRPRFRSPLSQVVSRLYFSRRENHMPPIGTPKYLAVQYADRGKGCGHTLQKRAQP